MAIKRKLSNAPSPKPSRRLRLASPVQTSLEPEEEDNLPDSDATEPDPPDTEEGEPVDPDEAYEETKALGDADRKVCVCLLSQIIH
jgi:hypothetical protein